MMLRVCIKLNENLQAILNTAVDMNTSINDIELKRYIQNITQHTKKLFDIATMSNVVERRLTPTLHKSKAGTLITTHIES